MLGSGITIILVCGNVSSGARGSNVSGVNINGDFASAQYLTTFGVWDNQYGGMHTVVGLTYDSVGVMSMELGGLRYAQYLAMLGGVGGTKTDVSTNLSVLWGILRSRWMLAYKKVSVCVSAISVGVGNSNTGNMDRCTKLSILNTCIYVMAGVVVGVGNKGYTG